MTLQNPDHMPVRDRLLTSRKQLLIGGRWVDAASGETFPVYNPADGNVIAHVASGDASDIDAAVRAARAAFDSGPWTKMTPSERSKIMWRLADLIDQHREEFAIIETLDNGKPIKVSRMSDAPGAAERFRYYAGWATKLNGETISANRPGDFHYYTTREAVGVAGLIVPWNFPLVMAAAKIAPAIAAGCTVILKPAEQTPLSALLLGELIVEAGFPDGVVNIVTGFGTTAGAALSEHPGVDKISFTGSTAVGKRILAASAGNLKRVTLELGGKSPIFIFPDADLEKAIPAAANGIFFNCGQVCAASSRLYAHASIFDRVIEGIAAHARNLNVGDGLDPNTDIGPMVSGQQLERVTQFLNAGVNDGASLITGGKRIERPGFFVEPTVFADTTSSMSIARDEIFGPVLSAASFGEEDLDTLATTGNDTSYGLNAYVWTRDISVAHKMARKLKAGTVCVNTFGLEVALPFGGYKQSGWGRENGREGIESYTELKSVMVGL